MQTTLKNLSKLMFSRRSLVSALPATAIAAAATGPAGSASAAQGSGIQRIQEGPGLRRPQNNGRDTYSPLVVTSRRRTVYIAGQLPFDVEGKLVGKGDMRAQLRQVCENIKTALAVVGGTWDDVVQTTTFVTDWAAFRTAMDVRHEYIGKSLPTSTTVQISALGSPDAMVEINAIATLD